MVYSSSYHSLHHTTFVQNFCLFCPLWDHLFGTVCSQTYKLQSEVRLNEKAKPVSAVFVVHGIEWNSLFNMPMVSPYLSTQPCHKAAWMYPFFPMCILATFLGRLFLGTCFTAQRWTYHNFRC